MLDSALLRVFRRSSNWEIGIYQTKDSVTLASVDLTITVEQHKEVGLEMP